jgi:hypothetical protein
MKAAKIHSISDAAVRRAAELLDKTAIGNRDGVVTAEEVKEALKHVEENPDLRGRDDVRDALGKLDEYLERFGDGNVSAQPRSPAPTSSSGFSALGIQLAALGGRAPGDDLALGDGRWKSSIEHLFSVPHADRNVHDGQSVRIPLEPHKIHMIELEYQDTRPLKDLSFSMREPGSYDWKEFRGDKWFEMLDKEKSGDVEIRRESDHNAPWENNPIRVKVEIEYPDGDVFHVGKKFLDFHVHDAYDVDSSGYPETDNINRTYDSLPDEELPPGCTLVLTPVHENRQDWESDRKIALELSWVKPIYVPEHNDRVTISDSYDFEDPPQGGFEVDPDRKIAGVLVTWTDNGGTASGSVRFDTDDGGFESDSYNVGSGETELIPCDGMKAKDGRLHIEGWDIQVSNVEVLYVD